MKISTAMLYVVRCVCVCNAYERLCFIGIDSSGGGGGCHSTFHTTQWIFHKLFSQTAYNSVSFWGKLYLIELNVGLECIVKYCAFCAFHTLSSMCGMHMPISLSVNDNNLHSLLKQVTHLLLILYVVDLIYSNKHSLNFIVDINNDGRVYKTSKSTQAQTTAFPYRTLQYIRICVAIDEFQMPHM